MSRATPEDDPQPAPPVQPDLDDCCHSGCNPCVFDRYDEALERYRVALAAWQARQQAHQQEHQQEHQQDHQQAHQAQPMTAAQHSKPRPRR